MAVTTRREFLRGTGGVLSTAWLAAHWPQVLEAAAQAESDHNDKKGFATLAAAEAAVLAAVTVQILPDGDTPGAGAAGAIFFVDRALGDFMAGARQMIAAGAADLDARADGDFATLNFDEQTALLKEIESTPFFGTMRFLTIVGTFAMPSWGGNRDQAGWRLLGFDHRHAWQPPFGFYDAAAAKKKATTKTTAKTTAKTGADTAANTGVDAGDRVEGDRHEG